MTIVLITAAVASAVVFCELETPIVILIVLVFNAMLNLARERRAESILRATGLTTGRARVRRDSRVTEVDANDLVPGEIVLLEAGEVVPADGVSLKGRGWKFKSRS